MYETRDLVRGSLRKAESELATLERVLQSLVALDAACFHAQQAAEKLLKAYLIWREVDFPFTHNLSTLLLRCQGLRRGIFLAANHCGASHSVCHPRALRP